ncbi:MAG: hypothetical protein PHT16_02910 [Candidatus Pacebacteria bacterium]|nr:hypothetical protein [Candidatus Paceibacterota bacterium]
MPANSLKKQLRNASPDAIKEGVKNLRSHISVRRWINPQNRYSKSYQRNPANRGNPTEVIARGRSLYQRQIENYIAASIFNHCSDGWSLLGRALNLHIKGDSSSSVHLAYYAELRAAMSILGSIGVGVFNRTHVIVTNTTRRSVTTSSQKGTHKFTWEALEHWADRKPSAETLSEIITPGSIALSVWLGAFNVNLHPIGRSWLKSWGIDIKQFGDDQILRNHSSYRPSRILPKTNAPAPDSLSFLNELWRMCEPNPSSRFDEIDKHLLRIGLAQSYRAVHGVDPRLPTHLANYRAWVMKHIPALGFALPIQNGWVDFLTWQTQPNESRIIEEASKVTSTDHPNHHLQVLARATLLLRISTGINGSLIREAGFTKADLEFWWQPYATDYGLIKDGTTIADFLDLWTDIDAALQDIKTWENAQGTTYSYNDLIRGISQQMFSLSECERISLWGLGI